MKFIYAFVALFAAVAAQQYYEVYPLPEEEFVAQYPEWYQGHRHRRDVSDLPNYEHQVGKNGKIFGTLGQNGNGLFGKGGYQHNIFNDHRGRLDASAHGTRVLGPYGDSSHLGSSLNWKNSNAAASLDVSKQIHGPASVNAAAGGRWPVGKNGDVTAQGFYSQTQGGGRDYGGMANFNYRF